MNQLFYFWMEIQEYENTNLKRHTPPPKNTYAAFITASFIAKMCKYGNNLSIQEVINE